MNLYRLPITFDFLFVEGSYVTPVTFKRGDLYARGYLIDWWRHKYPTRSIDVLVDFLVRD